MNIERRNFKEDEGLAKNDGEPKLQITTRIGNSWVWL